MEEVPAGPGIKGSRHGTGAVISSQPCAEFISMHTCPRHDFWLAKTENNQLWCAHNLEGQQMLRLKVSCDVS